MKRIWLLALIVVLTVTACGGGGFQQHSSSDVVEAFSTAGLPVGEPETLTKSPDDLVPDNFVDGTRFAITTLEDGGGRVYAFDSAEDLQLMQDYYEGVTDLFFAWVYTHDNVLLQLNGNLSEDEAREFLAVLEGLD